MIRILFLLLAFSLITLHNSSYAENTINPQITWLTNYEEAVNISRSTTKPIILYFTGSDWCGWCKKLKEEVLDTPEFAEAEESKFIFLIVDFPLYTTLPANQVSQNKQLQKKYEVRSFPTLLILDSKQQQIGMTGYRPGGGKQYATHLFKMVNDHTEYKQKVKNTETEQLSGEDLKQLYKKAKELGRINDANKIVKAGLKTDQKAFFLIERYRFLADEGQIHHEEAVMLKQELLEADPKNENLTHYQIAIIDFEASCEEERDRQTPKSTAAALLNYIEQFGDSDKDNLWRLQMIIAQIFFDKDELQEALSHAKSSYTAAPAAAQDEIATVIQNIQLQLKDQNHNPIAAAK